jgi:NAD(P)-dependent dehydrogenase (short-subunit alcohol dehydrogenase family)
MGNLDGTVAIIIGGATGVGKGIARAFAIEGDTVAIASRSSWRQTRSGCPVTRCGALPDRRSRHLGETTTNSTS